LEFQWLASFSGCGGRAVWLAMVGGFAESWGMQFFECTACHQLVHFENTICLKCGRTLGYEPLSRQMFAIEPEGMAWRVAGNDPGLRFKMCANGTSHGVCNWLLPVEDEEVFCRACRLNECIPDLGVAGNWEAWRRIEQAKRRLLHGLLMLGLPIRSRRVDPGHGLGFRFLAADHGRNREVLTGHKNGLITLNIAEADDAERERRRQLLGEPYRTLLGHLRHEVGHYYWKFLILEGGRLEAWRAVFGDERQNYGERMRAYYAWGPQPDWQQRAISAYATMHPWEDWAETWAHYMHMRDTLETAAVCGVSIQLPNQQGRRLALDEERRNFDRVMEDWVLLTHVLNNLTRGLGVSDSYPFVISVAAKEKLRFVHATIVEAADGGPG